MSNDEDMDHNLLSVRDLSVDQPHYQISDPSTAEDRPILTNVSIDIAPGEAIGVTGESGSGKSTLLRAILGLVDAAYISSGSITFEGMYTMSNGQLNDQAVASIRGSSLAFVWQNPTDMLHPLHRCERQITEHLRVHEPLKESEAVERAAESLRKAGVSQPASVLRKYPHELSGGEAQRVCLAQAMATRPKLLLADEVLSSLDPATSDEVVETLNDLVDDGLSLLFVSHDLQALAKLCSSTVVVYQGQKVEEGPTEQMLDQPLHHHTRALVDAEQRLQGLL